MDEDDLECFASLIYHLRDLAYQRFEPVSAAKTRDYNGVGWHRSIGKENRHQNAAPAIKSATTLRKCKPQWASP